MSRSSATEGFVSHRGFKITGKTVQFFVNGVETDRHTFDEDVKTTRTLASSPLPSKARTAPRFIFDAPVPALIRSKTGQ